MILPVIMIASECFHVEGSTAGKHTIEQCIDTVAASINYVLERTASVIIGKYVHTSISRL